METKEINTPVIDEFSLRENTAISCLRDGLKECETILKLFSTPNEKGHTIKEIAPKAYVLVETQIKEIEDAINILTVSYL